jgi:signal transduction histidine kinase
LFGLSIIVVAFVLVSYDLRRSMRADARQALDSTAYLLADHASRLFEVSDVAMRGAFAQIQGRDWPEIAASADIWRQLRATSVALPYVEDIWLNDSTGQLRLTTFAFPSPASDASDRLAFKAQLEPNDRLFVGDRIVGRITGRPTFLLARRLEQPPGRFFGMVSVTADLAYFNDYWSRVNLPPGILVSLVREGALDILAQHPQPANGPFRPVPADALRQAWRANPDVGLLRLRESGDGAEVAYRRVGELPVFLTAGIPVEVVDQAWRERLLPYGLFAAAASLAFAGLTLLGFRQARRDALSTAQLAERSRQLEIANRQLTDEAAQRELAEEQLRQAQKMEAVGRLTGGVAHDFNNLLTAVTGNLDLIRRRLDESADHRLQRWLANASEGAERAAALTRRLLAFSRQQPLAPKPVDVNQLVEGMSELLRGTLGERVSVDTVLARSIWLTHVDPNQLESAILNLAVNARDAMPEGGRLVVETANAWLGAAEAALQGDVSPGEYVLVAVSDTGTGMTEEVVRRAFDPFFTTKPVGKGTGLGLSQVWGFVKQSDGHAVIRSEPGRGTTVKLYLPRLLGAPAALPVPDPTKDDPAPTRAGGGRTILVVEDEALVREFAVSALEVEGYRVLSAPDGPSGLELVDAHAEIDLIFTDVVLKGPLNGRDVADAAVHVLPRVKILFTTGYTRDAIIHGGRLDEDVDLLSKPFTATELAQRVRAALGS